MLTHFLKKIGLSFIICSLILSVVSAQALRIHQTGHIGATQVTYTITFSDQHLSIEKFNIYDKLSLPDGSFLSTPRKPMIPVQHLRIALPSSMKVTSVRIDAIQEHILPGAYTIYPAQPPQTMNTDDPPFFSPDDDVYGSSNLYPSSYAELTGECDLTGQAMADLIVSPIHYRPAQQQVIFCNSITLTLIGTPDYTCGDYQSSHLTAENRQIYEAQIKAMVVNPEDVALQTSPYLETTGVPPGNYDYVIITANNWVSAFQPLAEWKTKKGTPAIIVTTDWIYNESGYNGSQQDKIRAFVQDVSNNWGATFFLLGGDADTVPCHTRVFSQVDPDPVPNDTYYADFDDDWVCEVNVGRASVTGPGTGTGQIGNFINKILAYEKNPVAGFTTRSAMFGFDLDESTQAEQCKMFIDNSYIPWDWTRSNVYDSDSGNHESNVIAALNAGQNLMNHADHSNSDTLGAGYLNHGGAIYSSDMDALSNGNRQGIFYSQGCDPVAFDEANCIAEHFVRGANKGGLAFIGNSRYGWYNPGHYDTLSMKYDITFFHSLIAMNFYKLGWAFSDSKNSAVENDNHYRYLFTGLELLGDPEMPVWTGLPEILSADFPYEVPVGSSSFTVNVTDYWGNAMSIAKVCLWKGSEVYAVGLTDSQGLVTFDIAPQTPGIISVTVTKIGCLPLEEQAIVPGGSNHPPLTPALPSGPSHGNPNVAYTFTTNTTDPDGNQVYYKWRLGSTITDWSGPYPSGATVHVSYTWAAEGLYEVKVKAKDTVGYESRWSPARVINITQSQPKPNLTVGSLKGGWFKVSLECANTGDAPATNLSWSINLTGGVLLAGRYVGQTGGSLRENYSGFLSDRPVLGFGKVSIRASVKADGFPEQIRTAEAVVLFFYVKLDPT